MFDLLNKFIARPWNVLKWRFVIVLWKYLNLEINTTFKSDFQIFNFKLRNYISVRSTLTWTAVLKPVQSTQVRFFMWFFFRTFRMVNSPQLVSLFILIYKIWFSSRIYGKTWEKPRVPLKISAILFFSFSLVLLS